MGKDRNIGKAATVAGNILWAGHGRFKPASHGWMKSRPDHWTSVVKNMRGTLVGNTLGWVKQW